MKPEGGGGSLELGAWSLELGAWMWWGTSGAGKVSLEGEPDHAKETFMNVSPDF